jgi:hypothetical protein
LGDLVALSVGPNRVCVLSSSSIQIHRLTSLRGSKGCRSMRVESESLENGGGECDFVLDVIGVG